MLGARAFLAVAIAACSGTAAGDAPRVVPERLTVSALPGGCGVLELRALTLKNGPAIEAVLENAGEEHACSAAFGVELFGAAQQSLAAGIGALRSQRFYRLTDGSGDVAECVGPGEAGRAQVLDLPDELEVDAVQHVVYRCPYFALDVVPVDAGGN